ncbi:MAG: hypothetical protein J3Q66DRAFT_355849 [Benniella sp.]|nr:MAG: hypothetical protein J3Q66DRAFT_355849 [Benniella sp.]
MEPTFDDAVFENPVNEEHVDIKDAKAKLAKRLSHRADPDDLIQRNILRDPTIAPAIQQRADELKRAQLEDALTDKLSHRPKAEDLFEHNILHGDDTTHVDKGALESMLQAHIARGPDGESSTA